MSIISLDYDGTFTVDPELWLEFVRNAKARGHEIIVVTMRYPQERDSMDTRLLDLVRVVFTSREQKRTYCARLNIFPQIWIDDMPEFIVRTTSSDYN